MQQILNFLIKHKTFLLFLLLFSLSLFFTIQSHGYHKSKFINSANVITGGIYEVANNFGAYIDLKKENEILLEENTRLKSILYNANQDSLKAPYLDAELSRQRFKFTPAIVTKNSYSASNNYLTINKGIRDSITQDLGVITSKGIIGIIDNTSNNYARVMSVLNTNIRVNAKLKKTDHIGSLEWNADSPEFVQLMDMPIQAPVQIGDTIVTGGRSTIFPKGIGIGIVNSFHKDATENYYEIQVNLFNDMTNIGHVYIIKNLDSFEISTLNELDE